MECSDPRTNLGKINVSKFASNIIFGKSRVVNNENRGFANLVPYARGVTGVRIRLGAANGAVVTVRIPNISDTQLRNLASQSGGVLTLVIVLNNNESIYINLNVKFDQDQKMVEPPPVIDEETQAIYDDISRYISGEGGNGICFSCSSTTIFGLGGGNWGNTIITTESL